jgi:hypothetical protein
MLSVDPEAHSFLPSQNIHVTKVAHAKLVMYITDNIPQLAHNPDWRRANKA